MNNFEENTKEETIDYVAIALKFISFWPLFIISILMALALAFFINRYTKPIYKANTTVLIQDEKKKSSVSASDIMQGFGLFAQQKNLENEMGILNSYSLALKTVQSLNFLVEYYTKGTLRNDEIYRNSPFEVLFDSSHLQIVYRQFNIKIIDNTKCVIDIESDKAFLFNYSNDEYIEEPISIRIKDTIFFGEKIENQYFSFKVLLTNLFNKKNDIEQDFFFSFQTPEDLALYYQSAISVAPINKESTIVNLSLEGANRLKILDYLDNLTRVYLRQNLEKKNEIAINTINFIDSQMSDITDSLHYTESKLQNFRSSRKVLDLSFQSQKVFDRMQNLESQRAVLVVKSRYYDYLKEYFAKNKEINDLIAPASMGIEDPLLNSLILELSKLSSEKTSLSYSSKQKNPYINQLDIKIENIKKTLIENIENIINNSKISIQEIDSQMSELTAEISKLPQTERELFGIERKFKLSDAMYTLLLQKRSEAQIAKASNTADNEIIDPARLFSHTPISPKKSVNYMVAFILGLLIPALGIFIRDYFLQNKILCKKDIEDITSTPILGNIFHNNKSTNTVVYDFPKSPISESFRTIRTNMQFASKGKDRLTILVTSSFSGEGKTFSATNIATVYANFNRKTIILGFDLRKPKLFDDFNVTNEVGISTYLIRKNTLEEVIQKTQIPNLDIITSGPIPPNPVELIASDVTDLLFEELHKLYDFIIIDTSPLGLVSDSYLLVKHTDINIFVVRENKTFKKVFGSIIQDIKKNQIPNFGIILNDFGALSATYGYGYGYGFGFGYGFGYGYGYGYGYGNEHGGYYDEETKQKRRFPFNLFSKRKQA